MPLGALTLVPPDGRPVVLQPLPLEWTSKGSYTSESVVHFSIAHSTLVPSCGSGPSLPPLPTPSEPNFVAVAATPPPILLPGGAAASEAIVAYPPAAAAMEPAKPPTPLAAQKPLYVAMPAQHAQQLAQQHAQQLAQQHAQQLAQQHSQQLTQHAHHAQLAPAAGVGMLRAQPPMMQFCGDRGMGGSTAAQLASGGYAPVPLSRMIPPGAAPLDPAALANRSFVPGPAAYHPPVCIAAPGGATVGQYVRMMPMAVTYPENRMSYAHSAPPTSGVFISSSPLAPQLPMHPPQQPLPPRLPPQLPTPAPAAAAPAPVYFVSAPGGGECLSPRPPPPPRVPFEELAPPPQRVADEALAAAVLSGLAGTGP